MIYFCPKIGLAFFQEKTPVTYNCNTIKPFLTKDETHLKMFSSHCKIVACLFIILLFPTALPFNDGFNESDQLEEWISETSPSSTHAPRVKRKYKLCGYLRWKCPTYVNLEFFISMHDFVRYYEVKFVY